jgi:hypothetical protein
VRNGRGHARPRSIHRHAGFAAGLLLPLLSTPPVHAQTTTLSRSDLALALYASPDGSAWNQLGSAGLAGFFGPHQCLCPDTLLVQIQLTSSGQSKLGSSTLAADFLLGTSCQTTPAACVSVGQASFSATQTAPSPTFSSSLVFQTVAGSATVDCASLTVGMTTVWAILAQDGTPLPFVLSVDLPVITKTVAAPTAVTALPANEGILVTWTAPADTSLVAGYQVLCLPGPAVAATVGYESCGLDTITGATSLTPADTSQLCGAAVPAATTSLRLGGLANGTTYTVGVIAIDQSGGVSAVSPTAQATPAPTMGFYEKYKQDGGAATGCSFLPTPADGPAGLCLLGLACALLLWPRRRRQSLAALAALLLLLASGTAQAQIARFSDGDDWAAQPATSHAFAPPDWGLEVGISLFRPAVDSELGGDAHPYADTFGNSRHLMSEVELVRYLGRGFGSWGVGLRVGYYKVTGTAFLADGSTRSGDETGLRLIPFALSLVERADDLPGLRRLPLIPYVKVGLDAVLWTASASGGDGSTSGLSPGWHVAGGLMLSLSFLAGGASQPGALAGPGALFWEWDYAAVNGLGLDHALHVGDSTWYAGLMFDL